MTAWRRTASGLLLAAVVAVAIVAAALTKLSHLPAWANALIASGAFVTGLALDPFKKIANDWFERPRQQNAVLLENTRMHNRQGRLHLVRECLDAMALGVHPAASVGYVTSNSDKLPPYVERDTQKTLRHAFQVGGLVVIEGASTAGKTRLAYQCMHAFAANRWLIVPSGPNSLREIIKAAVPLKNAVIWLDDIERYFLGGGLDAAVLDGICPPGSTDILVLGTLRAEARSDLNATGGDASIGRAFREVMQRAHTIWLDRTLTESEMTRARELRTDRRIADALDHTNRSGFAEYLAAGPATLDRWESARRGEHPIAGAIISAAIDARRAGLQKISRDILEKLHSRYLDTYIKYQANLPSFDAALKWATQSVSGASGCLLHVTDEIYEPFDYLLDHVQHVSSLLDIPEEVWPILIADADMNDLLPLGAIARAAGQRQCSEQALIRAATMGNSIAMDDLGDLLSDAGRAQEAEQWYRRAAKAGLTLATIHLGRLLQRSGRAEEANDWYSRAADQYRHSAEAGSLAAMDGLGDLLRESGHSDESEKWYRRAADAGYGIAMIHLGEFLRDSGRIAEAERWYHQALKTNPEYYSAMLNLGHLLKDSGRIQDAEQWYRKAVDSGYSLAMVSLGDLLKESNRAEEAEQWYRRAINSQRGYRSAMLHLGDFLKDSGRVQEAEQWYRQAAGDGYDVAMVCLGDFLKKSGQVEEAEQWYRRAADIGYDLAMLNLGELLEESDRIEEAEQWYRRAADIGYDLAMIVLADFLRNSDRDEEARKWYRRAIEADTDYRTMIPNLESYLSGDEG